MGGRSGFGLATATAFLATAGSSFFGTCSTGFLVFGARASSWLATTSFLGSASVAAAGFSSAVAAFFSATLRLVCAIRS